MNVVLVIGSATELTLGRTTINGFEPTTAGITRPGGISAKV